MRTVNTDFPLFGQSADACNGDKQYEHMVTPFFFGYNKKYKYIYIFSDTQKICQRTFLTLKKPLC